MPPPRPAKLLACGKNRIYRKNGTQLAPPLDPAVEIWAGGAGTAHLQRAPAGTRLLPTMEDAMAALADWRATHPIQPPEHALEAKS